MSYLSRLYNHRNAKSGEGKDKPFFSKQQEGSDVHKKTSFFQGQPPIQRLSTEDEKQMPSTNDGRMAEDKRIQEKPSLQKMELPDKKKEEATTPPVQKMSADPEKDKLHKKGDSAQASQTASSKVESGIKNTAGRGRRLPKNTAQEMSHSFGVDFSNVNIHDGTEASQLNEALNAQAFTHGKDIYFNQGKFNPEQTEGRHLLAHELTHVVQQDHQERLQKKGPDKGSGKGTDKDKDKGHETQGDIEKKYSILIEKGDKDWSLDEKALLFSALKRLSKDEATVLRSYRFVRWSDKATRMKLDKDYIDPGTDECGLHEIDFKKGLFRISMYDACFSDPEATVDKTAGIDTGEFHILHEMGHAVQNADLRNRFEKDPTNAGAIKSAQDHPVKDVDKLTRGQDSLTEYSKTSGAENFAEAFAVYKADPDGLKKSNLKLYNYFKSGGYQQPTGKR